MPNGNRLLVDERAGSCTTVLTVSPGPNVLTSAGNVTIARPGPTTVTGTPSPAPQHLQTP